MANSHCYRMELSLFSKRVLIAEHCPVLLNLCESVTLVVFGGKELVQRGPHRGVVGIAKPTFLVIGLCERGCGPRSSTSIGDDIGQNFGSQFATARQNCSFSNSPPLPSHGYVKAAAVQLPHKHHTYASYVARCAVIVLSRGVRRSLSSGLVVSSRDCDSPEGNETPLWSLRVEGVTPGRPEIGSCIAAETCHQLFLSSTFKEHNA